MGNLIALDSDVALNAAWARRAVMISYLPRSARVEAPHTFALPALVHSTKSACVRSNCRCPFSLC